MGIRMLHRRTAPARVHSAAAAGAQLGPDATPSTRPLPALAAGSATSRIPGTPVTALRAATARLGRQGLTRLSPPSRREGTWRLRADLARGYLALALSALGRLPRPRAARRVAVSVANATPITKPLSER